MKKADLKCAPQIPSVEAVENFLNTLPSEWQAVAAIMAFAGVRAGEIIPYNGAKVLRVADVDFSARKITIRAEVSKVRRARILTGLPANLWAWIEPLKNRNASENIAPADSKAWRVVKKNTGVELPKEALRYAFAFCGCLCLGAERTFAILGLPPISKIFTSHNKHTPQKPVAEKYFAILPQKTADCPAV